MRMTVSTTEELIAGTMRSTGCTFERAVSSIEYSERTGLISRYEVEGKLLGWNIPVFESRNEMIAYTEAIETHVEN